MSDQPEALRLADRLQDKYGVDGYVHDEAAACLRRQHAEIERMSNAAARGGHLAVALAEIEALKAERDALRAENEHLRKTAHEHVSRALYDAHTAELRAEVDALRDRAETLHRWHDQQLDRAEKAEAECDALRADAERYRWLREESAKSHDIYSNDAIWRVSRQQGGMGQNFFGNKIDAAIDAAREGK